MKSVESITPSSGELILIVGTVKGVFIFRSDRERRRFDIAGPYFKGQAVFSTAYLPGKRAPRILSWAYEYALGGAGQPDG